MRQVVLEYESVGGTSEPGCDNSPDRAFPSLIRARLGRQLFTANSFPDEETSLVQVFASDEPGVDERFADSEMRTTVASCLEVLDAREAQIVRAYFGLDDSEPLTLEEIGDALGVTRERVRQLRNRALEKMKAERGGLLIEFSRN